MDNCINDAVPPSRVQRNTSYKTSLNAAAKVKKLKYKKVCEDIRSSITLLVCTTDGMLHIELQTFNKRLYTALASKWDECYA